MQSHQQCSHTAGQRKLDTHRQREKEEEWMVDSGASYHITPYVDDFDDGTITPCLILLTIGNSNQIEINYYGQCTRKTGQGKTVVLRQVLFAQECPSRLIATCTGKMTKNGNTTFIQDQRFAKLLDKETGRTILQGRMNKQNTVNVYLTKINMMNERA